MIPIKNLLTFVNLKKAGKASRNTVFKNQYKLLSAFQ